MLLAPWCIGVAGMEAVFEKRERKDGRESDCERSVSVVEEVFGQWEDVLEFKDMEGD